MPTVQEPTRLSNERSTTRRPSPPSPPPPPPPPPPPRDCKGWSRLRVLPSVSTTPCSLDVIGGAGRPERGAERSAEGRAQSSRRGAGGSPRSRRQPAEPEA